MPERPFPFSYESLPSEKRQEAAELSSHLAELRLLLMDQLKQYESSMTSNELNMHQSVRGGINDCIGRLNEWSREGNSFIHGKEGRIDGVEDVMGYGSDNARAEELVSQGKSWLEKYPIRE